MVALLVTDLLDGQIIKSIPQVVQQNKVEVLCLIWYDLHEFGAKLKQAISDLRNSGCNEYIHQRLAVSKCTASNTLNSLWYLVCA